MSQDQVFGSYEQLEAAVEGLVHGGASVSLYADYAGGAFGFRASEGRDVQTGDTEESLAASPTSSFLLVWKKFGADLASSVKDVDSLSDLTGAMTPSTLAAVDPVSGHLMVIDYSGASEGAGGSSKITRLAPDGWNAAPLEQRMQLRGVFRLRRWQEVLGIIPSPVFSAPPHQAKAGVHGMIGMAAPRSFSVPSAPPQTPLGVRARKMPPRGRNLEDLRAARAASSPPARDPKTREGA